jgi:hypothetical protein
LFRKALSLLLAAGVTALTATSAFANVVWGN